MTDRERTFVAHKKLKYFPIIPKLRRLFISSKIAEHITWHKSHDVMDGVMVHPFNSEA